MPTENQYPTNKDQTPKKPTIANQQLQQLTALFEQRRRGAHVYQQGVQLCLFRTTALLDFFLLGLCTKTG